MSNLQSISPVYLFSAAYPIFKSSNPLLKPPKGTLTLLVVQSLPTVLHYKFCNQMYPILDSSLIFPFCLNFFILLSLLCTNCLFFEESYSCLLIQNESDLFTVLFLSIFRISTVLQTRIKF